MCVFAYNFTDDGIVKKVANSPCTEQRPCVQPQPRNFVTQEDLVEKHTKALMLTSYLVPINCPDSPFNAIFNPGLQTPLHTNVASATDEVYMQAKMAACFMTDHGLQVGMYQMA